MEKKKQKFNYGVIGAVVLSLVVGLVAVFGVASAFNGGLNFNIENAVFNISSGIEEITDKLGGSTSDNWNVGGNLTVAGSTTLTGSIAANGGITGLNSLSTVSTAVASTTLTNADSGKTFILTTTTEFVLPATSTSAGVSYKFVIGGAITSNVTIRTSDLGNNIEGTLIVAGAVVDCDAEDTITFVADGENIGDYVELWSNGTYWFIGDSGALSGSKLTCSTST